MAVPAQTLMRPLVWQQPALAPLLKDLQANILKSHGRDHTRNIFLRLSAAHRTALRAAIAALPVTSALAQLEATDAHRQSNTDGGPVVLCFLSRRGYSALGVAAGRTPQDPAFAAGLAARLGPSDPARLDPEFRGPVDMMLLVAAASPAAVDAAAAPLLAKLTAAGAEVAGEVRGAALRRDGVGIEHFGYVDGRSQPLMLDEEVVRELNRQGERFVWDPQFGPLAIALVRDPGGAGADSYGSYLVFRKLEQNVAAFDEAEDALADKLQLMGDDARELAGALVVGRFEDGTPVVSSKRALGAASVANNFTYGGDPKGTRCPVQAHIRKVNPRGDTVALGATLEDERSRLMPRRGIPYGTRKADLSDKPKKGVGLLFMAYNRDIGHQFEFVQQSWVDQPAFPRPNTGGDPVIGTKPGKQRWPSAWDHEEAGTTAFDFGAHVTPRGGEYFFAPSRGFLAALADRAD